MSNEIVKKAIKYIVEGIIVAFASYVIPKQSLKLEEVTVIALVAAATLAILDTFIPSMGVSSRQGAGLAIGTRSWKESSGDNDFVNATVGE
jgi:ABC-type Co2+ transport system permease subunit